jgi:hypothetical protein
VPPPIPPVSGIMTRVYDDFLSGYTDFDAKSRENPSFTLNFNDSSTFSTLF